MSTQPVGSIIPGEKQPVVGMAQIWDEGKNLARLSRVGLFWHLTRQALSSMGSSALVTIVSIITIGISLFILCGFVLLLQNLGQMMSSSRTELTLSLYLRDTATPAQVEALRHDLSGDALIGTVEFRDKKTALEEFRATLGAQAEVLSGLEESNPLPASFELKIKPEFASEEIFRSLASKYAGHSVVEETQYSSSLLGRLSSALRTFRLVAGLATILMLVLVSFIISNTIKLALYSRGQELEIMRLVGATRAFIRAPCLIEGMLQGLLGAALGLLLAYLAWSVTLGIVENSEVLKVLALRFEYLSIWNALLVIVLGLLVGALGSHLAVKPFLNEQIDI